LEHVIGFTGCLRDGAQLLPGGGQFVCAQGSSLMVNSAEDAHEQQALRGHNDNISAICVSRSGRLLATGQRTEADIIVWDLERRSVAYRLQEHDGTVTALCFTDDERVLLSAATDGILFAWDLASGALVAKGRQLEHPTMCIASGGFVLDVKGNPASLYQFATGGCPGLSFWALEPTGGRFAQEKVPSTSLARDVTALAFAGGAEGVAPAWLLAGTGSGDVAVFHVSTRAFLSSTNVSTGGVASLVAVSDLTHRGAVHALVGGGDGTVMLCHLAPPRGASAGYGGSGSEPLPAGGRARTVRGDAVASGGAGGAVSVVASLRVAGAVCSIALLQAPRAGAALGFLAATADGVLYRAAFTPAGGAARGASGAFPAPLGDAWASQAVPLRFAHGAAGEGLPPAATAFAGMFPPPLASPSGVTAALASGATAKAASAGALLAGPAGPLQAAMRCPDVLALAFPPRASDVLVTAGSDASVRVWDLNDYACTSVAHVSDAGFPVCVCAGTDLHISGWQDGCVRAWLLKPAAPGMAGADAVASGSVIRSGRRAGADAAGAGLGVRRAGAGAAAGPVRAGSPLWFIQDAHPGREGGVTAIALTGAERMLLTGGASGSVRLWDLRSRGLLATFKEHAAAIAQLVVLPGDGIAVSVSRDKTLSTWDLGSQRRLSVGTHPGAINAVAALPYPSAAFSAEGSGAELARGTLASRGGVAGGSVTLVTCSSTRTVEVWDGARRDPLLVLDYPSAAAAGATGAAARAAAGGAAAGSDGHLAATAGEPRAGPEGTCMALPHSRQDMMVTGGTDGRITFWELPALRVVGAHVATAGAVRDVAFSPDDRQVVATASDGTISVWNVY